MFKAVRAGGREGAQFVQGTAGGSHPDHIPDLNRGEVEAPSRCNGETLQFRPGVASHPGARIPHIRQIPGAHQFQIQPGAARENELGEGCGNVSSPGGYGNRGVGGLGLEVPVIDVRQFISRDFRGLGGLYAEFGEMAGGEHHAAVLHIGIARLHPDPGAEVPVEVEHPQEGFAVSLGQALGVVLDDRRQVFRETGVGHLFHFSGFGVGFLQGEGVHGAYNRMIGHGFEILADDFTGRHRSGVLGQRG